MPVTSEERRQTARRIPAEWRRIGRILGPEPKLREYDLEECELICEPRDRALVMLNEWAKKHGNKATRRHLIDAMIKEELKARVFGIFPGATFSDVLSKNIL